jgi:hypothetical protein
MWKICQEGAPKSKVIIDDSKRLFSQYRERYLAGFIAELGILRIEGKNSKGRSSERPLLLDGAEYDRGREKPPAPDTRTKDQTTECRVSEVR